MKEIDQNKLELDDEELNLLVWNISNEVINGFKIDNFFDRIGESEEEFKCVSDRLRSKSGAERVKLTVMEAKLLRNALAITLDELGVDEFSIRTGVEFDRGLNVLRDLNYFLM